MIICENCFCDTEVISVIRNKGEIGECSLCKCKNVHIYDTDKYEDLSMMFDEHIYANFFVVKIISEIRYSLIEERFDKQLEYFQ